MVGADQKTDIAVVKIDATNLACITLADSDQLRVGDIVFAVGNPLDVGETVTMGIVSAKGRNQLGLLDDVGGYENFIQTDAAINMGNSGGALVDAKGRLVGINSAIISTVARKHRHRFRNSDQSGGQHHDQPDHDRHRHPRVSRGGDADGDRGHRRAAGPAEGLPGGHRHRRHGRRSRRKRPG